MIYKRLELPDFANLSSSALKHLEQEGEKSIIEEASFDTEPEIKQEAIVPEQAAVNLEEIKQQSYQEGYAACQIELQKVIDELSEHKNLYELLKLKLLEVNNLEAEQNYKNQLIELFINIISQIGSKLYLILPTSFEQILREKVESIIENYYKNGFIKIIVHPNKVSDTENIIQHEKANILGDKLKNFSIISDNNLSENDCILEWDNSRFEFQVSKLQKEIDNILEQFKQLMKKNYDK
jgi:flagellar biosynthesis/type III secretory pathway protein FliH